MKVGDKWRLFVPSALAYGEAGFGPVPPNAVLIFDLELLDVLPPGTPAAPGGAGSAATGSPLSPLARSHAKKVYGRKAARFASQRSPPLTYDYFEHDFAKDPGPLIASLQSDAPLPKHLRKALIDLFARYRLKLKPGAKRIPSYRLLSDAEAKLKAAAEELALRIGGPITRAEMDNAVKVMQARARSKGRGRISSVPKRAAQELREEAKARVAASYNIKLSVFENYLARRRGSSRRNRPLPPTLGRVSRS